MQSAKRIPIFTGVTPTGHVSTNDLRAAVGRHISLRGFSATNRTARFFVTEIIRSNGAGEEHR